MLCPLCGRGLSEKYVGVEHFVKLRRKIGKLFPGVNPYKTIPCKFVRVK